MMPILITHILYSQLTTLISEGTKERIYDILTVLLVTYALYAMYVIYHIFV